MSDFHIRAGDTSPAVAATLSVESGDPIDLTGVSDAGEVRFQMAPVGRTGREVTVDAPATVVDAATGAVEYNWQPGDIASSGTYYAVFRVTYPDGTVESFPNDDGGFEVAITEAVA